MVENRFNLISGIVIFFILLFVFAKWGPAINFSTVTQNAGQPMIVTGEGKATAVPDIAKIDAGIQDSGTTLTDVQNSVNKKSQSFVSSLKKLGIEDKDIKTTSYNVIPQQNYQANPPIITGYQVSVNYEITVRKIDIINNALTTITGSAANLVGGVSFDLSDEAKAKALDSARTDAVTQAKQNAESLAKASGITLGKIINVSENQTRTPTPIFMAEKAVGLGGAAPSVPNIQPGTTEIDLTVSLSYEVR